MKRLFFFISIFTLLISINGQSQERMTVEEYIGLYTDLAIKEMKVYKIPASITLAQGILESENGNSPLAIEANNHFGIKCHEEWTGKTYTHDDDIKNECFRKYGKAEDSFRDHSEFLTTRDRYKPLFELEITDYKGWAYGLKKAGYATNPRYPEILIRIIEENGLAELDKGVSQSLLVSRQSGGSPQQSAVKTQNSKLKTQNSKLKTQNSKLKTQNSEAPSVFDIAGRGGNDRMIFLNNDVKFILAREGDDFFKIAAEFGIYSWQIREYNDLTSKDKLTPGQKIYLEKKKKKSQRYNNHIVQEGETLYSVAQGYGIRLNTLCRMNGKTAGDYLTEGEKLKLK